MANPSSRSPTPAQPVSRRWWLWCSSAVLVLVLMLAGSIWAAVHTERGTRWLWQTAARLLGERLDGELVGGTLARGVRLRQLQYRGAGQSIRVDRAEGAWRVSFQPLTLQVSYVRLGSVDLVLLPQPDKAADPLQEITLPLAVRVDEFVVRTLRVHQDAATTLYRDIRLRAASDGVQHEVALERAQTPWGVARLALDLNGVQPFVLDGSGELKGDWRDQPYRVDARFSGSLTRLAAELTATGNTLRGRARLDATPLDDIPLRLADIDVRHFNPRLMNAAWPLADLDIRASLAPTDATLRVVAGPVSMRNALPGTVDSGHLPLESAYALVRLERDRQQLLQVRLELPGKGTISGSGELRGQQGQLQLQAEAVNLQALHAGLRKGSLSGPLQLQQIGERQTIKLQLKDPAFSVEADAGIDVRRLVLHKALLQAGPARLQLAGELQRNEHADYAFSAVLSDFNPGVLAAGGGRAKKTAHAIKARINSTIDLRGALRPQLGSILRFKVYDSHYDGLPMAGEGRLQLEGKRLLPSEAALVIAGNDLRLKGSFGAAGDRLHVDVEAPALQRIGFGLAGMLRLHGWVGGTLEQPLADASYRAEGLTAGGFRLAQLAGSARISGRPSVPESQLSVQLSARGLQAGPLELAQVKADLTGSYAAHQMQVTAAGRLRGQPLDLKLDARGRVQQGAQGLSWSGSLQQLENRGLPELKLLTPLTLTVAAQRIELGSSRLQLAGALLDLRSMSWMAGALRSAGTVTGLDVAHLLSLWQQFSGKPQTVRTDLVLDGSWNVAIGQSASGFVEVTRRSGDFRALRNSTLGLRQLSLRADLSGRSVVFVAGVEASRIGTVGVRGSVGLQQREGMLTLTPQSALQARLEANIPDLKPLVALADPSLGVQGRARIDLSAGGTLGQPVVSGQVNGDELALTLYDQGIHLDRGVVRLVLERNIVQLQQVEFRGGEGSLSASGRIPLDRNSHDLTATVVARRLQLLASPAAQLTLSGQATAAHVSGRLLLDGTFNVDRARFTLPEKSAPKLGDDVVIVRGGVRVNAEGGRVAQKPVSPYTPALRIKLDLGNDVLFTGSGADMRLAGQIELSSEPGTAPRASGTIRVVEGSYEAFGTKLIIERGLINFQGPLDDPNLNILAMRRNAEVAAGVQVTGTVQRPRVQLVSEPELSAEEKLSWLVFGRSGGNSEPGQAQAAVKGAGVALLNSFGGARIAKGLGLDQLSIGDSEFGLEGGQVVNLGKEISDRLYVGYEQSLEGAESVLKLSYQLSQYWSLVLRGGTVTGVDAFYSKRFDSIR